MYFNAKIRKENMFIQQVKKFDLHYLCSKNGIRPGDFTFSDDLIISSRCFKHKNINKDTQIFLERKTKKTKTKLII